MSILFLNISSTDATNVASTTQNNYTFTQWQSFHSMNLVNVCIPNVQYNITSGNKRITVSGTTYTISQGSFRITFTGTASFTLSFSQGVAQVLGFLPHTTYTANRSFVITAPNTVNLSPNDTYFLTILNLPNSNQSSGSFTFSLLM